MPVPQTLNFLLVGWSSSPPAPEQAMMPVPQTLHFLLVGVAPSPPGIWLEPCNKLHLSSSTYI